ncbi:winged helix-turn-helix domain-containing protein [Streptomyces sp. NPDC002138]|uniref:winged helix-turn-helix domain-containing protein n=1 Tax=Streptomyces sp. NPDC002138 TaxID=3154410 RepID=UPI00331C29A6
MLDPFRQTVERDGMAPRLTPHESTLLHCLIRHRDSVLSKHQILEDVWEADWRGRSNIVELYISYLRKKVDTPFGRNSIETVRGLGYRLSS